MSTIRARRLANRKRRIQRRLRDGVWAPQDRPMLAAAKIHYELADKARGLSAGGIGLMHLLARRVGLIEEIDRRSPRRLAAASCTCSRCICRTTSRTTC